MGGVRTGGERSAGRGAEGYDHMITCSGRKKNKEKKCFSAHFIFWLFIFCYDY